MSERLISRANSATPSDSFAAASPNNSFALLRNTFCTSIAIACVSGRRPAMSANRNTTLESSSTASKKSPPQRGELYRASRSRLLMCGRSTGWGEGPSDDPDSDEDEAIQLSRRENKLQRRLAALSPANPQAESFPAQRTVP